MSLRDAISRRLAALDDGEREVLQAICVIARPIDQSLLRSVTDRDDVAIALRRLQADRLVRLSALGRSSEVTAYHDRIRESVVAGLDESTLKRWHSKLARGIEASDDPDLIALTEHLLGAGELEKAGACAIRAADHAAETLAFENAARLYRVALELAPGERENQRQLQIRLGRALANAGRGAEAAPVFMQAAEGASPEEAVELRQLAAEQWMSTGHLAEGMGELDKVLRSVGLKLHSRPSASIIHHYQRGEVNGLRYIVSGGGGAPLYRTRCGVKGRRKCKVDDGMLHVATENHYVMLEVTKRHFTVCPKYPDGSPLEKCIRYKLKGK